MYQFCYTTAAKLQQIVKIDAKKYFYIRTNVYLCKCISKIANMPYNKNASLSAETNVPHQKLHFNYIPSFDIIRGIATICVLLVHASYGIIIGGWIGVDLFFVLSGFLITSLLQKEFADTGKINVLKFYARRIFRLMPGLLMCVAIANLLWEQNAPQFLGANRGLSTLASLLYFSNFIPEKIIGSLVHLWSLCVEEHFYLVWPLFTSFLLFKHSVKNRLVIILAIIVAVSVFKIYAFNHPLTFFKGIVVIDTYRNTFCRIDGILTGAFLSVLLFHPKFRDIGLTKKGYNLAIGFCALLFIFILLKLNATSGLYPNGGFIFTNLLCVLIIFIAFRNPDHFIFSNKLIRWVGTRSYGIYIYHYPIFAAFEFMRKGHSMSNLLLVTIIRLAVSFIVAELSFRLIEKPVLTFKKRFAVEKVD